MHWRAFSHDDNIWFSSQYDWQISAFGDKAGTEDKLYELQTSSDHQFEAAQLGVSRFHWFVQLGLWLWCFAGVQLGHKVVLCLPWSELESPKKKRREWASRVPLSLCLDYLSGLSVSVLFLTSAYPPFYIYLLIEIFREGDSTVHLGTLFQCLIILFGNMIVLMCCCKCCCKEDVIFCLTQSGYAEEFISSLHYCLMHWRWTFMYELTYFSLVFSRLNSLTRCSCFSHFVSLFSSSALCSISSHSPWLFLGCESCIYVIYNSYQSRGFFFHLICHAPRFFCPFSNLPEPFWKIIFPPLCMQPITSLCHLQI